MSKIARVIDFETNGTEPPAAQVCEIGYSDVDVETRRIIRSASRLCHVDVMPPDVRAVHHISPAECRGKPPFSESELADSGDDTIVAFVAHNSAFEAKFFTAPKPWICTYKAALRVWPSAPSHSNGVLRYWLEEQGLTAPVHAMTQPAHRAGPDTYVTAHTLIALLNSGVSGQEMAAWTKEPALLPTCPIGKFRGKPWPEVEHGFLGWMVRQPDMEADLVWNARREIERRFPPQEDGV